MKKFYCFFFFFNVSFTLFSQSCLPNGAYFNTQDQVDNFNTTYPGCKVIEGGVFVTSPQVLQLDSLYNIESIGGDLLITSNDNLTSISGLKSLKSVGQAMRIQHNPLLKSLNGLEALSAVRGDFFYIGDNTALENLNGLSDLDSIGGIFQVWENPKLTDLNGLQQLQKTGNTLAIFKNEQLTSLNGLQQLTAVGSDLRLEDNPLLNNISALDHPITIDGALVIIGNTQLSDCAVKSVCNYIAMPATFVAISGNQGACATVESVTSACVSSVNNAASPAFQITPNPTASHIFISAEPGVEYTATLLDISGKVLINNTLQPKSLDISHCPPGNYFLQITGSGWHAVHRIVRQ